MKKFVRGLGALISIVFTAMSSWATSVAPLPPMKSDPGRWALPPITIQIPPGIEQPIQIKRVEIRTDIFAAQAQTQIDLVLFNSNGRVLEGELQFPLRDGQVVTGFALDVNGKLRDAVPVPKARGQEIFEAIRRNRIDPGLLEVTANNQYKLRVYPIPSRGQRHVRITVRENLKSAGSQWEFSPAMHFSQRVDSLKLEVAAAGYEAKDVRWINSPSAMSVEDKLQGMSFSWSTSNWTPPATWQVPVLQLKRTSKPQMLIGESAGQRYFAAHISIKDELKKRPIPKHIALLWDASGSARQQAGVLAFLDAYFKQLGRAVKVSLIVVRNQQEAARVLMLDGKGLGDLADVLRQEPMDGSSNFDELKIPDDVDMTLMVSDGLMTDGKRSIGYTHKAPLFAINTAAQANVPRLRRLSERTGGAYIEPARELSAATLAPLFWQGWQVKKLDSFDAKDLLVSSQFIEHDQLTVLGVLDNAQAQVNLLLEHVDGRRKLIQVNVSGAARAGKWPGQMWAQRRSFELAENEPLHQAELQRIAAKHGMVGPNSSLIVLEQASDYARYDLPAPPELEAEVRRLKENLATQRTTQREQTLVSLTQQLRERQTWWSRTFSAKPAEPSPPPTAPAVPPVAPSAPVSQGATVREQAAQAVPSISAPRPAAPPPPPPAPAPAPVAPRAAPAPAPAMAAAPAASLAANTSPAQLKSLSDGNARSVIEMRPFNPDANYIRRLTAAEPAQAYAVYLDERGTQSNSAAFYLEVANWFFDKGETKLAMRILSNLAEMNLENRQLLRLYAYRLVQAGQHAATIAIFERIAQLAPDEPQSWRDLGLAYAETGQYQRAVDRLWEAASRPWHVRFQGLNLIALTELNAALAQAKAHSRPVNVEKIPPALLVHLPLDLRVVASWDTDDTDIDLSVTDPLGNVARYNNKLTTLGGLMSPDATGGYGPEEFSLRRVIDGPYTIEVEYYSDRQQVLSHGTVVMVRVSTAFGSPMQKDQWLTLKLTKSKEKAVVGRVQIAPTAQPNPTQIQ